MTSSPIPDPLQMWREALTKLESNVNSLVTGSMDSQEVMRSVHQLSTVSLGLQQAFEKAIGSYLAKVNLPSRKDVSELAAALQRVEHVLAGVQRHLALGRSPAEQYCDAAEIARIRDLYAHRPSPTMRTSGLSCTPCTRWTVASTY